LDVAMPGHQHRHPDGLAHHRDISWRHLFTFSSSLGYSCRALCLDP
jgi:hypothetical protein